jgi:hypothetical protein
VKNNGIVPQYYIEDNHEVIIPKELFYKVQEEKARRTSLNKAVVTRKTNKLKKEKNKFSSKYALTEILYVMNVDIHIVGRHGQNTGRKVQYGDVRIG